MGANHQALLMAGAAAVAAAGKAAVAQAFPGSTFSTSSASYTNLLNGSGGAAIQVTLTKSTGTKILISAGASLLPGGTGVVTIGVNDGTSDTDVTVRNPNSGVHSVALGEILLPGLAAGTYTFTLRIKTDGTTFSFDANCSAFIEAWEVT